VRLLERLGHEWYAARADVLWQMHVDTGYRRDAVPLVENLRELVRAERPRGDVVGVVRRARLHDLRQARLRLTIAEQHHRRSAETDGNRTRQDEILALTGFEARFRASRHLARHLRKHPKARARAGPLLTPDHC
jgi:hypothetical protein